MPRLATIYHHGIGVQENSKQMYAILIHGMGRTPFAMSLLAVRLRVKGIRSCLFAYSVTFEKWDDCLQRLKKFILDRVGAEEYIIIGHSLGTVLTRAVLPRLVHKPAACFFLAPPVQVCTSARIFGRNRFARLIGGDFVRLLVDEQFMRSLPPTGVPTRVYAGTGGPRGRFSPFGSEPNDGVLTVQETRLPDVPAQTISAIHPFIMNSMVVIDDIVKTVRSISSTENQEGEGTCNS